MATFLLIHGMWHGAWCWQRLTPHLRMLGHEVYTVALTGSGERAHLRYPDIDMNTHIQDVVAVMEYEDLHKVMLVGHSLAGYMIAAVAERTPQRITHLVNLDGILPVEGKALRDIMPQYFEDFRQRGHANGDEWWVPPVPEWTFGLTGADLDWMRAKLTPYPLKTWLMPMPLASESARAIPRTFIRCTDGYSAEAILNDEQVCLQSGWQYRQLATGHDVMLTAPKDLSQCLHGLV